MNFTIKEVANIYKVDGVTILNWCKKGFFHNAVQDKFGKKAWKIPRCDIDALKLQWNLEGKGEEKTCSTKEAADIFKVNSKTINSWCIKGYFSNATKENHGIKMWKIPEHDINQLKNKWSQDIDIEEKFYTIYEVSNIFKVSKCSVSIWIRKGYFPNVKKIRSESTGQNIQVILEKDLQIFKKNYKSAELNTDLRYYSGLLPVFWTFSNEC